ncbi:sensor histidine kinase [Clostridium neuense]|uniref:histidine kinase n=1 Tax=Clostridium neuense TaxID=1728934 RepID=A0ABW8TIS4_9CLOT
MKLWEKIFICTLVVFEVFFVPSTIYLINRSFKIDLQSEIDSGINEQNRFCDSVDIVGRMQLIYMKNNDDKNNIDSAIISYIRYVSNEKSYFQIFDANNKVIYDSFGKGIIKHKNDWHIPNNKVTYEIKEISDKNYLYVNKVVNVDGMRYMISYIKEISVVYRNYRYLYNVLIKLNIFVCITLVIVMMILSKIIISPVNKLIKSTKEISDGNFNVRVNISTRDEIGTLANNFNYMAGVIQNNINTLKESSEDKQKFIDDLSHELRSPLTSIIGYTDYLITNKDFDEETLNSLNYVYKEGKRLQKMSSKLMDLIVLRKERPNMRKYNIKGILKEIEASMLPRLKEKNIELIISSEEIDILLDRELIFIFMRNFIDNAIKASKPNSQICVRAYLNGNPFIEIEDHGIGIPKEDVKRIFSPFYMVDKARDRRNNGVGLGLSICDKIARIHNAEVKVQSELGVGTIVMVKFKETKKL